MNKLYINSKDNNFIYYNYYNGKSLYYKITQYLKFNLK